MKKRGFYYSNDCMSTEDDYMEPKIINKQT